MRRFRLFIGEWLLYSAGLVMPDGLERREVAQFLFDYMMLFGPGGKL